MKFLIIAILFTLLLLTALKIVAATEGASFWEVQSVDTMKYSRDTAREKLNDASFDLVIEQHVSQIASTGATHVAIGTPYDEEFIPMLKRWVSAARRNNLNAWFRGNWSGWEGWFNCPKVTRKEHLELTKKFIREQADIFEDGDIFSACPECENGGPGDPRQTGDTLGFRQFLIDLNSNSQAAFKTLRRNVTTNYFSMNGDVARLIMDPETTKTLGGIGVIDHYVKTPEKLVADIKEISIKSQGKAVLGEFGVPIPDIHGQMTPEQQANWISEALSLMAETPELIGINYWTSYGGSTKLWDDNGKPRPGASVLSQYFAPKKIVINVTNELNESVANPWAIYLKKTFSGSKTATIDVPFLMGNNQLTVSAMGYKDQGVLVDGNSTEYRIQLIKIWEDPLFKIRRIICRILGKST